MTITKKMILETVGNTNLTFGKAGLHHYYFEYSSGHLGIYKQRKDIHVRTLSQFPIEKWATIGKEFCATFEDMQNDSHV